MPSNKSTTNSILSDWLYGEHYPDSFLDMPQSIRTTRYGRLDDNDKYVREKRYQSNKCAITCESSESSESDKRSESNDNPNFQHICPNNPILTCNCGDPADCPELGSDPDNQQPNQHGNIICPDSGRICSVNVCPSGCKGDSEGKSAVSGWPCVVVGGHDQARDHSAECVHRTPDSSGFAK